VKYANVITASRTAHANRLNGAHRPPSLLSGLLVCGCCGRPYALRGQHRAGSDADRQAVADVEKKIKEIVTVIEDGGYNRPLMTRLRELEAKQDELTERLSRAPDIHPNVAGIYRRKVERLAEALRRPQERDEAAEAIRALIDHITLTPGPRRGEIDATWHGDLGTILEWTAQKANTPGRDGAGVSVSVVAGGGFEPPTFRL